MSGLEIIETDKTYANSIVVVDASSNGHDWDGDPVIAESCSDVLGTMTAYLVDKGILPSKPNVVMMSEHQARDQLFPNGARARIVESPLLILVADRDGSSMKYGKLFIYWMNREYSSRQCRPDGHSRLLPVYDAETEHLPLRVALQMKEVSERIVGALVGVMLRNEARRIAVPEQKAVLE
ncbi:MAG: hypothetical protein PHW63_09085 [Alphaproteobacteria bacterium]|nr:hypothetical protein [Alphaproteobacteria bacterium]